MGDVTVFGGDPGIIATRLEIERVHDSLALARSMLLGELEAADFLTLPIRRIGLALEAQPIIERIGQLQQACLIAAQEYFDGEVQQANRLDAVEMAVVPLLAAGLAAIGPQLAPYRNSEISAVAVTVQNKVPSATSLAALLTRLERTAAAATGQVRIEQFGSRFIVYIPGTQSWLPMAGKNPLDLTSNLQAMAGPGLASSEAAVQKAIVAAGVTAENQVLLVGHSQGGMVAANIASKQQNYKVAGLVTIGSPISQLNQSIRVPTVSLQHTNDIVPKLDLKQNAIGQSWVTFEREAPTQKHDGKPDVLEAHEIGSYRGTALLADENLDPGLARVREQITGFANGQGKATIFQVSR